MRIRTLAKTIAVVFMLMLYAFGAAAADRYYLKNNILIGTNREASVPAPAGPVASLTGSTVCGDELGWWLTYPLANNTIPAGNWTFRIYAFASGSQSVLHVDVYDHDGGMFPGNYLFGTDSPVVGPGPATQLVEWTVARPQHVIPAGRRLYFDVWGDDQFCGGYSIQVDFNDPSKDSSIDVPTPPPTPTGTPTATATATPTSSATACPCEKKLGYTAAGADSFDFSGRIHVNRHVFYAGTQHMATSIAVYVASTNGISKMRAAIYNAAGMNHGPPIVESGEITPVTGWNIIDIPDTLIDAAAFQRAVLLAMNIEPGIEIAYDPVALPPDGHQISSSLVPYGPFPMLSTDLNAGNVSMYSAYINYCPLDCNITPTNTPSSTVTPAYTATNTPTLMPTMACDAAGNTHTGDTADNALNPWSMYASRYYLDAGTLTGISVYCTGAAGNVSVAVYSDMAGSPGAKMGESGVRALKNGWNNVPVICDIPAAGYYWLAFQFTLNGVYFYYDTLGAPPNAGNYSFPGGPFPTWPASWGFGTNEARLYSIYAQVCVPVTPTPTCTPTCTGTPTDTCTFTATFTITATPSVTATISLQEAVDNFDFTWIAMSDWFGQQNTSYYGGDAAQSAAITDSGWTFMQSSVSGPGQLSFYWKASTEPGDIGIFVLDGNIVDQISGDTGWIQKTVNIDAGTYDFFWEYDKDASGSAGADAIWVDKLEFTYMSPTATETSVDTATASPSATSTESPVPSATNTPVDTATASPSVSSTESLVPSATNTPVDTVTDTATNTPANTMTNTPVDTATASPSVTGTESPVPSATDTPVDTATALPSVSSTESQVPSATNTPADTATNSPTPTGTPTSTGTPEDTATNTPVDTATGSATPTASATATAAGVCLLSADANTAGLWHFDEGSGLTLNDSSGNGNNGVISGAMWNTGKYGTGLSFDGTNDIVTIADSGLLDPNLGSFTVEFWMKTSQSPGASGLHLMQKFNQPDYDYWIVDFLSGASLYSNFGEGIDGTSTQHWGASCTTGGGLNNNAWHYIAVVFDRAGQITRLYVDGAQVCSNPFTPDGDTLSSAAPVIIGGDIWGHYSGMIDEMRISTVARSAADITGYWNCVIGATATVTPTITQTHSVSPTPTDTPTDTVTRTFTYTPTLTYTPVDTATASASVSETGSPVPSATNTPVDTATNTPINTATNTPVDTATASPSVTGTESPVPSATNTPMDTATNTPVDTATNTPMPTSTNSAVSTATQTVTVVFTLTSTPVYTPTITPTQAQPEAEPGKPYCYPQPAGNTLHIVYALTAAEEVAIKIYNFAGIPVASMTHAGVIGKINTADMDLTKFSPGIYYYVIRRGTALPMTGKFLVVK